MGSQSKNKQECGAGSQQKKMFSHGLLQAPVAPLEEVGTVAAVALQWFNTYNLLLHTLLNIVKQILTKFFNLLAEINVTRNVFGNKSNFSIKLLKKD